jgi:hypothetical protein
VTRKNEAALLLRRKKKEKKKRESRLASLRESDANPRRGRSLWREITQWEIVDERFPTWGRKLKIKKELLHMVNCASGDFVDDMGEKLMMEMVQKRRFLGY